MHPSKRKSFLSFSGLSLLFLFFLTSCGDGGRNRLEEARLNAIIMYSRAYATDHQGKYPPNLAELYPKYIDVVANLYSPPQSPEETNPQAYYYRPGLSVGAKVDEPIVVSPHVVKGKVNVGYRGGFIRKLEFEEAQKILSEPGWVQEAPPVSGT